MASNDSVLDEPTMSDKRLCGNCGDERVLDIVKNVSTSVIPASNFTQQWLYLRATNSSLLTRLNINPVSLHQGE